MLKDALSPTTTAPVHPDTFTLNLLDILAVWTQQWPKSLDWKSVLRSLSCYFGRRLVVRGLGRGKNGRARGIIIIINIIIIMIIIIIITITITITIVIIIVIIITIIIIMIIIDTKQIPGNIKISELQKIPLLGTSRILRKTLSIK